MTPDELEKRIRSEYAEAYREIKKTTKDYFDNLQDRISKQQLRLQRGEIDQNYYKQWLLNQAGRGERYKDLEKKISDRLIDARKTATAYTNDTTPGVYTLNRNYSAYQIDMGTGPQKGTAWTAWDESTLKRLQTEDRQLVPLARTILNINKAERWNKQHIQSALTSAILQGKSVGQLADSFEALALMDRNSSLRNARTALTGAQNAGRQEAYREADEMGITIKKEWICTQDSRTRDSHIELDGQIVDYDKPFTTSDGNEIMYPGDPTAEPCEVWNCRCTMRAILPKHKVDQERVTYKEWLEQVAETKQTQQKMQSNTENITTEKDLTSPDDKDIVTVYRYNSIGDPMKEVYGSAEESNPKETEEILKILEKEGVQVIRTDKERMGYSPNVKKGKPGEIILSRGCSYSGLLHEYQHYKDDKADGFPGFNIQMQNSARRYYYEKRAYEIEIKMAKEAGRKDIVKRLRANRNEERKRIYGLSKITE